MDEQISNQQRPKTNWTSVIVFYLISCAVSWPFFWWRDINSESWNALQIPVFIKTWSYMWGPGIAALICFWLFRKSHIRTITFFGTSRWKSLAFYFLPIIALCIPGIKEGDQTSHLLPLAFSVIGFISILGEELGWRGFLQDALRQVSPLKRYALIGILWELWHFTNRTAGHSWNQALVRVGMFILLTIALSFIIGAAVDYTRSLVVAVTLHAWFNILFEFPGIGTYIVFGASVVFWIYMLMTWRTKNVPDTPALGTA